MIVAKQRQDEHFCRWGILAPFWLLDEPSSIDFFFFFFFLKKYFSALAAVANIFRRPDGLRVPCWPFQSSYGRSSYPVMALFFFFFPLDLAIDSKPEDEHQDTWIL